VSVRNDIKGPCTGFIILISLIFVLLLPLSCQKVELTEEEQRTFKGCIEPRSITQEDAFKYLHILIKGDPETIRWYREYEKDEKRTLIVDRRSLYQEDICAVVKVISRNKPMVQVLSGTRYMMRALPKNKHMVQVLSKEESEKIEKGYNLILQVIEQKADYPRARACAIKAIGLYGEFRDGKWYGDKRSLPVLKEAVNDKDPEVRLQAAGVLLSLGEGDIALPVLDELARAGISQSTTALDKLFMPSLPKLWDERGKDIIIKALSYPGDEVKAYAALKLVDMGVEKELAEATAIKILERLKDKKRRDYSLSDRKAGYNAIAVLEKTKSASGAKVLKLLIKNNEDTLLQKRAKKALEIIYSYLSQRSQELHR
jgi:HEAT repeat protein